LRLLPVSETLLSKQHRYRRRDGRPARRGAATREPAVRLDRERPRKMPGPWSRSMRPVKVGTAVDDPAVLIMAVEHPTSSCSSPDLIRGLTRASPTSHPSLIFHDISVLCATTDARVKPEHDAERVTTCHNENCWRRSSSSHYGHRLSHIVMLGLDPGITNLTSVVDFSRYFRPLRDDRCSGQARA
jgi:hypothetical protein